MEWIIKRFTDNDGNNAEIMQGKNYSGFRVLCYDKYLHVFKATFHTSLKSACAAIKRTEKQTGEKWRVEK